MEQWLRKRVRVILIHSGDTGEQTGEVVAVNSIGLELRMRGYGIFIPWSNIECVIPERE